jgi:hypothetical protein
MMTASAVLAGSFLVATPNASAFTISMDFDDLPVNGSCEGLGSGRSYVSSEESYSGLNACTMWIEEGMTGWGTWGGTVKFPQTLSGGDEIWVRVRVFMPEGFDYTAPGEGGRLKFLRVRTKTATGDHIGYDDIYLNGPDADPPYGFIYEGMGRWQMFGSPETRPKTGQWETFEWHMRLSSSLTVDEDGALIRFWKNNELLLESTQRKTLVSNDDIANYLYIFTYWNGGSPQTQHLYIDDLVVTTETPPNLDEYGNPFIGAALKSSPPKPPTISGGN